ncbi:5-(carboxyamino)imidazole ribonucleotide synthase [Dactylosporangium aurantiacum]|uniref:N5-carboxyaminoimidazole ribonucleotide synthase n=1 Tax=Dactylosporangium aurantiacum TaxID=35754 RepID=A0A9Q9ICS6_9ACTN|nr:5-(carboxyamino)imidazole ribonucleotide synthase [Dactylosporangium aurantiacum]MDG6105481.1 5-(carboxyamino)imidazole ribonucleotide synthase [Dactylosporangium aurantiacum]UWZ53984.1 5-(carboxyamino)imidazole ribonucleotide synthase [Dactylosporangium aurantiacum]
MDSRTGLPVVGMVGGGQLARMTHQAAIALGQSLRVLAVSPDDGAALVAADVVIGRHDDIDAVREFAKGCDVVTFDHEHVPGDLIRALAAEGVTLLPGADALRYAQNKREMRTHLAGLGFPVPRWTAGDLRSFGDEVGWPIIVKTATGGYDGRGVFVAHSVADVPPGVEVIGEELVALKRELAAVVARSPLGQVAAYPVVETVQKDGICVEVLAPAPGLDEDLAVQAQRLAIDVATRLGVVGVLAVELFETTDGRLLVNELAMRPHNSAHWTIEGARTSQFEQHLRAVLDYPMGDTRLTAPAVVMANVLGGAPGGMSIDERLHHLFAEEPGAKVHLYGKQVRPGRKIGHVTVLGDDLEDCRRRAARAARILEEGYEH